MARNQARIKAGATGKRRREDVSLMFLPFPSSTFSYPLHPRVSVLKIALSNPNASPQRHPQPDQDYIYAAGKEPFNFPARFPVLRHRAFRHTFTLQNRAGIVGQRGSNSGMILSD